MKKIYVLISILSIGFVASAQQKTQAVNTVTSSPRHAVMNSNIAARHGNSTSGNNVASVIWSDDFSNPVTWTISHPTGVDDWTIGTTGPAGSFPIAAINSTTAGNGYALFDSDLHCSPTHNQIADLTTATSINCSASPSVRLVFQQYYRKFYDSTYVFVSNNGTSWTKFVVNPTLTVNTSLASNPETVRINISSVAGSQATVWVRFEYYSPSSLGVNAGCGYAWMIDDVSIEDVPSDDVGMSTTSFPSAYSLIPLSQVQPMTFSGNVFNNGASATSTATMSVDVYQDFLGNLVYTGTSGALALNPGDTGVATMSTSFTPADTGFYIVRYVANVAGDADNSNDTLFRFFAVDDSAYARDYTAIDVNDYNTSLGFATGTISFASKFHVAVQKNVTSMDVFVVPAANAVGDVYNVSVYSENTITGKPATNLATSQNHVFVNSDTNGIFLHLPMLTTATILAGNNFFAVGNQTNAHFVGLGFSNNIYTTNTVFYNINGAGTWSDISASNFYGAFILRPYLTDLSVGLQEVAGVSHFAVFPNPANGRIYYNLSLDKADEVRIDITDRLGKNVYTENIGSVSNTSRSLDMTKLASGVYYMTVTTSKGTATEKLVLTDRN